MKNLMDISHFDIESYILDKCNPDTLEKFRSLRQEENTVRLLLDMIDNLKQISTPQENKISNDSTVTFSDVENTISTIQAGMVESEYAQKTLNRLIHSPVFFERFYIKLNQIASVMNPTSDLPELQEVAIKTDEKILEEMGVFKLTDKTSILSEFEKIKQYIKNLLNNISEWYYFQPKYAYSISTALAAVLIIVFIYGDFLKKDPFESYIYTNSVPYEYDISSLRGVTEDLHPDPLLESFKNQFKQGISDYVVRDYIQTIQVLEKLEPIATEIEDKSKNKESIRWIRELYFYLGVSHLALGRNQGFGKVDIEKHLLKSIQYLLHAKSLISKHDLDRNEREIYFLGLVYGFSGNTKSAIEQFEKIEFSNDYYKESQELIQELLSN